MKKITLFFAAFAFTCVAAFAQTASFESSEGYTTGQLAGQDNWATPTNLQGQVTAGTIAVSNEKASDGSNSVKFNTGGLGFVQYSSTDSISTGVLDLSFDVYLSSTVADSQNDVARFNIGSDIGAGVMINFSGGEIQMVNQGLDQATQEVGLYGTTTPVAVDTDQWITVDVSVDLAQSKVDVLIAGDTVATTVFGAIVVSGGSIAGTIPATKAAGVTLVDFGGREAFVDNIVYGDDPLGLDEIQQQVAFKHYTQNERLFVTSQSQIGQIAIYNLLGQEVATQAIDARDGSVNLSSLTSGIYLAKVEVDGQVKSFKFVK